METITKKQVEALKKAGNVAHIYPRKKIVCVNGYQYYKLI